MPKYRDTQSCAMRLFGVPSLTMLSLSLALSAQADTFRCAAGDVPCLINAINEANGNGHFNTIRLDPGAYALTAIDNRSSRGDNGLPLITSRLTVRGTGTSETIVTRAPGAPPFRLFHVGPQGNLTIDQLTLTRGVLSASGGAVFNEGGVLNISRCVVSNNSASGGGAVMSEMGGETNIAGSVFAGNGALIGSVVWVRDGGKIRIMRSRVSNNADFDGPVYLDRDATAFISHSTFDHNRMVESGVLTLSPGARAVVTDSAFIQNRSNFAGVAGMFVGVDAAAFVKNTTFGGNMVGQNAAGGAAVTNFGTLILLSSTLADNAAVSAGGFRGGGGISSNSTATTVLANTIVARNTDNAGLASDCRGPVVSFGNNLIGDPTDCIVVFQPTDLFGDPGLAVLTDDGSPGNGHVPLSRGSQAIDAGNDLLCPKRDQLRRRRVGPCDIGAVEFQRARGRHRETSDDSSDSPSVWPPANASSLIFDLDLMAAALSSTGDRAGDVVTPFDSLKALLEDLARDDARWDAGAHR